MKKNNKNKLLSDFFKILGVVSIMQGVSSCDNGEDKQKRDAIQAIFKLQDYLKNCGIEIEENEEVKADLEKLVKDKKITSEEVQSLVSNDIFKGPLSSKVKAEQLIKIVEFGVDRVRNEKQELETLMRNTEAQILAVKNEGLAEGEKAKKIKEIEAGCELEKEKLEGKFEKEFVSEVKELLINEVSDNRKPFTGFTKGKKELTGGGELIGEKAKEIAGRRANGDADEEAKKIADKKAKEDADKKAKEDADKKAKEDADKKAKERKSELMKFVKDGFYKGLNAWGTNKKGFDCICYRLDGKYCVLLEEDFLKGRIKLGGDLLRVLDGLGQGDSVEDWISEKIKGYLTKISAKSYDGGKTALKGIDYGETISSWNLLWNGYVRVKGSELYEKFEDYILEG